MLRDRFRPIVLAAAAAAVLLLAACSGTSGETAADAGQPVSGGSLTWGIETEPITFNPHLYAQAKARLLVANSFEGLLTHDANGGYVPLLATGYQASVDGRTYTFKLRTGVTFVDGTPFDAAAVKAPIWPAPARSSWTGTPPTRRCTTGATRPTEAGPPTSTRSPTASSGSPRSASAPSPPARSR